MMIQDQINLDCNSLTNSVNLSQIQSLMSKIEETTATMSDTFQQTILKHEEQFIKSYKIKIYQLTKLFHQLKRNIEDKFINNAITQQLQTVIKERDYFKYECLKLNTQYKNVLDDYKNLTQQMVNITQQMNIYKHLLANEKIKGSQIQKNSQKLRKNLSQLTCKTIKQGKYLQREKKQNGLNSQQKELIVKFKREIKQKDEKIRAMRERNSQMQDLFDKDYQKKKQIKQLQEIFKSCVQSWKRQILSKAKRTSEKSSNQTQKGCFSNFQIHQRQEFSALQKKELLHLLFTNFQFLIFIQKLLFNPHFQVQFLEVPSLSDHKQQILINNRNKLYDFMKKKGLISSTLNKPLKFR